MATGPLNKFTNPSPQVHSGAMVDTDVPIPGVAPIVPGERKENATMAGSNTKTAAEFQEGGGAGSPQSPSGSQFKS